MRHEGAPELWQARIPSGRWKNSRPNRNTIAVAAFQTVRTNNSVSVRAKMSAVPWLCATIFRIHGPTICGPPYGGLQYTRSAAHSLAKPSSGKVMCRFAVGHGRGSGAAQGSRSNGPSVSMMNGGVNQTSVSITGEWWPPMPRPIYNAYQLLKNQTIMLTINTNTMVSLCLSR
jgi:hypothetical protein